MDLRLRDYVTGNYYIPTSLQVGIAIRKRANNERYLFYRYQVMLDLISTGF